MGMATGYRAQETVQGEFVAAQARYGQAQAAEAQARHALEGIRAGVFALDAAYLATREAAGATLAQGSLLTAHDLGDSAKALAEVLAQLSVVRDEMQGSVRLAEVRAANAEKRLWYAELARDAMAHTIGG